MLFSNTRIASAPASGVAKAVPSVSSSRPAFVETLEERRMLSVDPTTDYDPVPVGDAAGDPAVEMNVLSTQNTATQRKGRQNRGGVTIRRSVLTTAEVRQILAQAGSQAREGQAVVVVDREGFILGIFGVGDVEPRTIEKAVTRARTSAFFQSEGDAFTPRTARFIIQDRFPHPVPNTVGGPLYGVQFSSLLSSDVLSVQQRLAITGDPGGIPLFKKGKPVGGVGVAGDFEDVAVRREFRFFNGDEVDPYNRAGRVYPGGVDGEERDFDEAVALAGARGFMAPDQILATRIFVDGLRFPFIVERPATERPNRTFAELVGSGRGRLIASPILQKFTPDIVPPPPETHPTAVISGVPGHVMNPIVSSDDTGVRLTAADVRTIIANAVATANNTRALIRQPLGVPATVHIAVTDKDGDIVGVFRMEDGTRFSYDVAVQKARTSAFFSDEDHAFATRAVGFMSQGFFPPAIESQNPGPLFRLQNELSSPVNLRGKLRNGITIFPGGVPLYKDGVLVGGLGISGDGVDQDDIIAFGGSKGFRPRTGIRSDNLPERKIIPFLRAKVQEIDRDFVITSKRINIINRSLDFGLGNVRLPYTKFPRNPEL